MSHLLAWTPFLDPIPIWSNAVWPWLLLPLAVAVSVVYKSIKCRTMRQVPGEASVITITIVLGMVAAAVVLAVFVRAMEW
ncbi:MAG TPA: hypothetical protein VN541_19735 [Tepidisphaeraceae bacterium]|nr:hypothetical protein [Tepidisphaeraceae bacterium]